MRDTTNREGLTFEEWVCAAGVAVLDATTQGATIAPYTYSYQRAVEHDADHYRRGGCFTDRRRLKRETVRYYSPKIRKAWRDGEDPSDWRAEGT